MPQQRVVISGTSWLPSISGKGELAGVRRIDLPSPVSDQFAVAGPQRMFILIPAHPPSDGDVEAVISTASLSPQSLRPCPSAALAFV